MLHRCISSAVKKKCSELKAVNFRNFPCRSSPFLHDFTCLLFQVFKRHFPNIRLDSKTRHSQHMIPKSRVTVSNKLEDRNMARVKHLHGVVRIQLVVLILKVPAKQNTKGKQESTLNSIEWLYFIP